MTKVPSFHTSARVKKARRKSSRIGVKRFNKCTAFQRLSDDPPNQLRWYRNKGAPGDVLTLVKQNNTEFSNACKGIVEQTYGLKTVPNDVLLVDARDRKYKVLSVRHQSNGTVGRWQHIQPTHDWDFLVLVVLNVDGLVTYCLSHQHFEELCEMGVITPQGEPPNQGYWFKIASFKKRGMCFQDYVNCTRHVSVGQFINYEAFQRLSDDPLNQLRWYRDKGASQDVLTLVKQSNTSFSTACKGIVEQTYGLKTMSNGVLLVDAKDRKYKVLSVRHRTNGTVGRWQHIQSTHDWDFLVLVKLTINELVVHRMSRRRFDKLRVEGVITPQGKPPNQGYWFDEASFEKHGLRFQKCVKKMRLQY